MKYVALALAGLMPVLLAACTAAPQTRLQAPMAEARKADHVIILLEQSEIRVDDADFNAGSMGLVGLLVEAAVESTMTKNRQEAIAPLRDALLEYGFEDRLVAAIQAEMPASLVKPGAPVKLLRTAEELRDHVRTLDLPANLFVVKARYGLEQEFQIAYVHAAASLLAYRYKPLTQEEMHGMSTDQRKAREPQPLHQGSYYSEHVTRPLWGDEPERDGLARYEYDARRWAADDARLLRDAFAAAAGEIAGLVHRDVDAPVVASGPKVKAVAASAYTQPFAIKAPVAERRGERVLLVDKVNLRWVDPRQIKP